MAVTAIICAALGSQAHGRPAGENEMAAYTVWFTDEEDSSVWIFAPQSGEVENGAVLTIPFPEEIVGADGHIWTAVEESPKKVEVFKPGNEKFYISYRRGKKVKVPQQPEDEGKKRLDYWMKKAWEADCLITGNQSSAEPEYALISEDSSHNNSRLTNLVTMVRNLKEDSKNWHYIYMIGRDYKPQTLILGNWPDVEYSSAVEETFTEDGSDWTVLRVGMRRRWNSLSCSHQWNQRSEKPGKCLEFGVRDYVCALCDTEEKVLLPPFNHRDENGDSLCDVCSKRAFIQQKGDTISTVLKTNTGELVLSFTCVDENYRGTGRMMYLADQVLDTNVTGICFGDGEGNRYQESSLRNYFTYGFANDISVAPALMPMMQEDGREDRVFLLSRDEYESYRDDYAFKTVPTPYFLRTQEENDKILTVFPDGEVHAVTAQGNETAGARPFILFDKPVTGEEPERHFWKVGEVQVRITGGKERFFRCIDEDYSDIQGTHRKAALFLCDDVIRSDEAIVHKIHNSGDDVGNADRISFGQDNNYKNSYVRKWLMSASDTNYLEPVSVGVASACSGITEAGMKEEMNVAALRMYSIGFQLMRERMFCLSVEEALKYRESLWKFSGADEDNEKSQITPRSIGYYLRTPVYREDANGNFRYSDEIYSVDLEKGNIRPVKTDTTEIGIRPVFAMKQGD